MNTDVFAAAKDMMSASKFYMGYSRWEESLKRYENWEESVSRVMNMHRRKYAHVMTPELAQYIDFAESAYAEKAVLGSQRALQFGGEQIFKHEARLYNCLGVETRFVTSAGMRSFADFHDGDITEVMTHTGSWKRAVVRNYGKQILNTVVLSKSSGKRSVRATANHRWIQHDGTITTNLQEGMRLFKEPKVFAGFEWNTATIEERLYWAYGFVYGDGTLNNGYSLVRLCDHKRKFEERFTALGFKTSSSLSLEGDVIVYTGKYQKALPDAEMTPPELTRAFIAGYLDADRHKSSGVSGKKYVGIQTSSEEAMYFIENVFPVAGVHVVSSVDLTGTTTNFGTRGVTKTYTTCDSSGSKYNAGWKVETIVLGHHMEDVWCLEVEDDHSFVLDGGIVTGNCSFSYVDRARFFQEAMYLLLCGCGVGFSVQRHHVAKLPAIQAPASGEAKVFTVPDSIEGWADAFGVLLSSYFVDGGTFPEYQGKTVHFDVTKIRPRGALISGGFKAPGSDGLVRSLEKCRELLNSLFVPQKKTLLSGGEFVDTAVSSPMATLSPATFVVERQPELAVTGPISLTSLAVYDFVMHMADAVLSGGIRRAATICIFSKEDQEMMTAKTGDWFIKNPQRGRSNNSVLLIRDQLSREEFAKIMTSVRDSGEPGFIFAEDTEFGFNPLTIN